MIQDIRLPPLTMDFIRSTPDKIADLEVMWPRGMRVPRGYKANLEYRRRVLERCVTDMAFREECMAASARDVLFWCNTFAWTYDPRRRPANVPFVTWPFQDETISDIALSITEGRDLGVVKSRDMGASWMILLVFTWRLLFHDDETYLVASRTKNYVDDASNPKSLFWKIDYLVRNCPPWMVPPLNRADMRIANTETNTTIDGESTTGNIARGDRRTAIMIDEFGAFAVRESFALTAASQYAANCRIFNSTVPLVPNAFNDLWQRGQMQFVQLHWSRHPEKARGLYIAHDGKKRSPWYDNECKRVASPVEIEIELDMVLDRAVNAFYEQPLVDALLKRTVAASFVGDAMMDDPRMARLVPRMNGPMRVWGEWRQPVARRIVVGVDVGMGTGASNSVLSFFDAGTGEKFAEYVDSNIPPERLGVLCAALCKHFAPGGMQQPLVIWESAGPGRIFGENLMRMGHANVYWQRTEENVTRRYSNVPGWKATRDNKKAVHGEYRRALTEGEFFNPSHDAVMELREIVYAQGGSVEHRKSNQIDPSGARENHGDRPTADALAWHGARSIGTGLDVSHAKVELGTMGGRMASRDLEDEGFEAW